MTTKGAQLSRITFLTATPVVAAALPPEFDRLPHLRTAIGTRHGRYRHVSFFPYPRFTHPSELEYLRPLGTIAGADGAAVELYEQREPPPVRMAVWGLEDGFVTMAFNPWERDDVERTVERVAIAIGENRYPRLRLSGSFRPQDQRAPASRDIAMFCADGAHGVLENLTFSNLGRSRRDADTGSHPDMEMVVHYERNVKVEWTAPKAAAGSSARAARGDDLAARFRALVASLTLQ